MKEKRFQPSISNEIAILSLDRIQLRSELQADHQ